MDATFSFKVNGQTKNLTTDSERTLLDVLREEFQLTGTKYGCGEGQCRACTVLVDGKSVAACLTTIAEAANKSIVTIEGLIQGSKLHPVQEVFLAEGAFQCGYCTPGMIVEVAGLLQEKPAPTDAEIRSRMQKHLCRCCSYPVILKAVKRAVAGAKK